MRISRILFVRFMIVVGLLFQVAFAAPGTPGPRRPVGFSLAAPRDNPAPRVFTLAATPIENWQNTAFGTEALVSNTSYPGGNSAFGFRALFSNTSGDLNSATGCEALLANTTGGANTANGVAALYSNTTGAYNTAIGMSALYNNVEAHDNTAVGAAALSQNIDGYDNTAVGGFALNQNINGNDNIAIGNEAGNGCVNGNFNIFLGAHVIGLAEDTHTIRIGRPYVETSEPHGTPAGQTRTFVAGIVGSPVNENELPAVVGITSEGRLGTMSSDLLPPGPAGPPGEGFVEGSLLFLRSGFDAPSGFTSIGTTDFVITTPGSKKVTKITVNVYQKQ